MGGTGSGGITATKMKLIRERWRLPNGDFSCFGCDKKIREGEDIPYNLKGQSGKKVPINYILVCKECSGQKQRKWPKWVDNKIESYMNMLDENVLFSFENKNELIGILFDGLSKNLFLPNNRDLSSLKETWISIEKREILKQDGIKDFEEYCNHLIAIEILKSEKMMQILLEVFENDEHWESLMEEVRDKPGYVDFRKNSSIPEIMTISPSDTKKVGSWRVQQIITSYIQNLLISESKINRIYSDKIEMNAHSWAKKVLKETISNTFANNENIIWFDQTAYYNNWVTNEFVEGRSYYREELLNAENQYNKAIQKIIYLNIIESILERMEIKEGKKVLEILEEVNPLDFDDKIPIEIREELKLLFGEIPHIVEDRERYLKIDEILQGREKYLNRLGWNKFKPSININKKWANLQKEFGEIKKAEEIIHKDRSRNFIDNAFLLNQEEGTTSRVVSLRKIVNEGNIKQVNLVEVDGENEHYSGDTNHEIKAHGKGAFDNGEILYIGDWWNGKIHGNGEISWRDKEGGVEQEYNGEFKWGKPHGKGTIRWPNPINENYYKGEFENGYMHGKGKYQYVSKGVLGGTFEGEYLVGHKTGYGVNDFEESKLHNLLIRSFSLWENNKRLPSQTREYIDGKIRKDHVETKNGRIDILNNNKLIRENIGEISLLNTYEISLSGYKELLIKNDILRELFVKFTFEGEYIVRNSHTIVKGQKIKQVEVITPSLGECRFTNGTVSKGKFNDRTGVPSEGEIHYKNGDKLKLVEKGNTRHKKEIISGGRIGEFHDRGGDKYSGLFTRIGKSMRFEPLEEIIINYGNQNKFKGLIQYLEIKSSKDGKVGVYPKEGTLTMKNGNTYTGEFGIINSTSVMRGAGRLEDENGNIHEGIFESKQQNDVTGYYIATWLSEGILTMRNGNVYTGKFSMKKRLNEIKVEKGYVIRNYTPQLEEGVLTYKNGNTYTGEFKGYWPRGKGCLNILKSGEIHEGIFESKRENDEYGYFIATWLTEGTLTRNNGDTFTGKFSLYQRSEITKSGYVYRKHIPQLEEGVLTYKNGNTYTGEFKGYWPRGKGCLNILKSGENITRDFKKNEISELGTLNK
ncbi:MAG: hypothetical protein HOL76_01925 [Euryarchaeota archaeon]|jgi:hypothetical protein|nr:hypothetical protein [Euryarchaeota archaeon]